MTEEKKKKTNKEKWEDEHNELVEKRKAAELAVWEHRNPEPEPEPKKDEKK